MGSSVPSQPEKGLQQPQQVGYELCFHFCLLYGTWPVGLLQPNGMLQGVPALATSCHSVHYKRNNQLPSTTNSGKTVVLHMLPGE